MWRMRTARYPLRLSSPFREIQGGSPQAGEPGVLRDSEAWGGSHRRWFNPRAQKDAGLPDWGRSRRRNVGRLAALIFAGPVCGQFAKNI